MHCVTVPHVNARVNKVDLGKTETYMIQKAASERPLVDPSVIVVGNQRKEEEKFGECFVQILQTLSFS